MNINIKITDKGIYNDIPELKGFSESFGGESYSVNKYFLLKNGKPWFPVMGEFHYSRYPCEYWEESILKIKSGGVNIISTYIFWIHHEELQGCFDWDGNNNLRRFVALCKKHGMKMFLRIGPWVHGECRNGGFPDWLVKSGFELRTNDERYLACVKSFYQQIFLQVKGMMFRDGGPIIGIQLENEYGHVEGSPGKIGRVHMQTLKKIALETGFTTPYYTATGWGNVIVLDGETLPVQGGYPDAPWDQHTFKLQPSSIYLFGPNSNITEIATDHPQKEDAEYSYDVTKYPYLTAELGGGVQVTHHRRPLISADDVEAIAFARMGSWANLLGFYMYHGGTNPVGKLSTLQESRETGYPNDLPVYSYDFQAPIREFGQISDTYRHLKTLSLFLNDFGENMAESCCFFPEGNATNPQDTKALRYSVRYGRGGGFLFAENYQRGYVMEGKKDIRVTVSAEDERFSFDPFDLPNGKFLFMPFCIDLNGVRLYTATAQLLCKLENGDETAFIFFCFEGDRPIYRFSSQNVQSVHCNNAKSELKSDRYKVTAELPGMSCSAIMTLDSGKTIKILTITRREAENAWKIRRSGSEQLFVTEASVVDEGDCLTVSSRQNRFELWNYPPVQLPDSLNGAKATGGKMNGEFRKTVFKLNEIAPSVSFEEVGTSVNGEKNYLLNIHPIFDQNVPDNFLVLRFSGDQANFFLDGKCVSDWYYTGADYEIGLKRFRKDLANVKTMLSILPLHRNDQVYLEAEPHYDGNVACKLESTALLPEYRLIIRL